MEEVKRRLGAIDDILVGNKTTSYKYTNVEFVALQFRKIFELIILATLASHHHLFEGLVRKLSKEWQISKVVAIVKKKNPEFYPAPIDRVLSTASGTIDDWRAVTTGFLTLDELISAHGTIANIMHAINPYRDEPPIDDFEKQFSIWRKKLASSPARQPSCQVSRQEHNLICRNAEYLDRPSPYCSFWDEPRGRFPDFATAQSGLRLPGKPPCMRRPPKATRRHVA